MADHRQQQEGSKMQNNNNSSIIAEDIIDGAAEAVRHEMALLLEGFTASLEARIAELEAEAREAHAEIVELEKAYELEGARAHDLEVRLSQANTDYNTLLYAAQKGVLS